MSWRSSTDWLTDVHIGFVGLGNIGGGAAANLARAGLEVTVFDLDRERVDAIVAVGGHAASSPSAAARGADVMFTSLPGPSQIEAVGLGTSESPGIIGALDPGATWVELSTNDLTTATRLRQAAEDAGVALIDAPVSGGPEGAQAGNLSIFVGGHVADVERVRPLLDVIGERVTHVGAHGAGITAKIAQVTLCYTQTITLIEALLLGAKGGVEPHVMLELIQNSAGSSYVADTYGPEILAGTYDASFPISHAAKDMRLAIELADAVGANLPFMADVRDVYTRTEEEFGPQAPHLLAAQLSERENALLLHEHRTAATIDSREQEVIT